MQSYENQVDTLIKVIQKLHIDVRGIVEAGARDCRETVAFSKKFPDAEITAFECNPSNIPICKKNIQGTKIRLIEKALSDEKSFIDFHILPTADNGSSSIYAHKELQSKVVKVPTTTLVDELQVFPTLLWLDAQGAELSILKGCGDKITDISIIHTEIYFKPAYHNQPTYRDIKKYLHKKGFHLLMFTSYPGNFSDAIFVIAQALNDSEKYTLSVFPSLSHVV